MKLHMIWVKQKLEDWRETYRDVYEYDVDEEELESGFEDITKLMDAVDRYIKDGTPLTMEQNNDIIFHLYQIAQGEDDE